MKTTDVYKTKDLYLAAFLYAEAGTFLGMEREGRVCWFVFGGESHCTDLAATYWSGQARCGAKQFADSLRSLKDMLFA